MDGSTKLRMRAVPVLLAERAAGRSGAAAALMIAAWMDYSAAAAAFQDPLAGEVAAANRSRGAERTRALLALVSPTPDPPPPAAVRRGPHRKPARVLLRPAVAG